MSITDELRKWAEDNTLQDMVLATYPPQHAVHGVLETLLRIADRIDEAHHKAMSSAGQLLADAEKDRDYNYANWQECKQKVLQHNITIDELNARIECLEDELSHCIELPKDEDGEYIRVGDVLTDDAEFKSEGKVMRLMLEDKGWMVGLGCGGWTEPLIHEWRHSHDQTVEDVLREFAEKIIDSQIPNVHPTYEEAIDEYAAKLRLADDGEEQ